MTLEHAEGMAAYASYRAEKKAWEEAQRLRRERSEAAQRGRAGNVKGASWASEPAPTRPCPPRD